MAPPYGEPDWASPGDAGIHTTAVTADAGLTPNAATVGGGGGGASSSSSSRMASSASSTAKCYVYGLSILNLGLACLMGALGVLAIIEFPRPTFESFSDTLLAVYLIIFAGLLFSYELIWWQPLPILNKTFRKNFGFLYGLMGKGFYLIFTALLTIGFIQDDKQATNFVPFLDWITGIAWLASGFLHLFVACQMPDVKAAYVPPKTGYENDGSGGADPTGLDNGGYRNAV